MKVSISRHSILHTLVSLLVNSRCSAQIPSEIRMDSGAQIGGAALKRDGRAWQRHDRRWAVGRGLGAYLKVSRIGGSDLRFQMMSHCRHGKNSQKTMPEARIGDDVDG
jgi:hypothetical protein